MGNTVGVFSFVRNMLFVLLLSIELRVWGFERGDFRQRNGVCLFMLACSGWETVRLTAYLLYLFMDSSSLSSSRSESDP